MLSDGFEKTARVLSTKARKKLSDDDFALPGRRYPIHDKRHAANARARVDQYGTAAEKATVYHKTEHYFHNA